MRRRIRLTLAGLALLIIGLTTWIGISSIRTEQDIASHAETVRQLAGEHPSVSMDPAAMTALPAPVQRYLAFAVPDPNIRLRVATLAQEGDFRRP